MPVLLDSEGADLVVLDAGDSILEAGEGVRGLAGTHPGVEVVVVADGDAELLPQRFELRLWPKWQRLEKLLALVEPPGREIVEVPPQFVS